MRSYIDSNNMKSILRTFLETETLNSSALGVYAKGFFEVDKYDDIVVVSFKENFDEEFDWVRSISTKLDNDEIIALIMNVINNR